MHTQNLVAEFLRHILDHFLCSVVSEHFHVFGDGVETLKTQPQNTVLSVLNSGLSIQVTLKVLLEFVLVFKVFNLAGLSHKTSTIDGWLIVPIQVEQGLWSVWVDVL